MLSWKTQIKLVCYNELDYEIDQVNNLKIKMFGKLAICDCDRI